jgi:hypothetical protein
LTAQKRGLFFCGFDEDPTTHDLHVSLLASSPYTPMARKSRHKSDMKHLIVVAHASEDSFTMELARAYRAHELAPVSTENPVSPFQDAHICA